MRTAHEAGTVPGSAVDVLVARVISASVTRFVVGQLGTRQSVAWYADGIEQPQRFDRQIYPTAGTEHGSITGSADR